MTPVWYVVLCALATGTAANPMVSGLNDMYLKDDSSSSETHDYDLSQSFINKPLVSSESISVECLNCHILGTAEVTSSGINKDESFFGDIEQLFELVKDPSKLEEAVAQATNLNISLNFLNTSGSFDFDISLDASIPHTFNLFNFPVFGLPTLDGDKDNIGVILLIDLLLEINVAEKFTIGFEVSLGDSASIVLDPIGGKVVSSDFSGFKADALHSTLADPEVAFTASLRATLEVGTTITLPIIGKDVSFEAGLFVDLVKYEANVTSTETRALSGGSLGASSNAKIIPTAPYSQVNGTSGSSNGTSRVEKGTSPVERSTRCATVLHEKLSIDVGAFAAANISSSKGLASKGLASKGLDFEKAVTTTLTSLPLQTECL